MERAFARAGVVAAALLIVASAVADSSSAECNASRDGGGANTPIISETLHPVEPPSELPVFDVAAFRQGGASAQAALDRLQGALKEHGFLYLANHGVPEEVVDGIVPAMRRFFALPFEEKNKISPNASKVHPRTSRGYISNEILDVKRPKADVKELLDMGREGTEADIATPFQGPNNWPEALAPEVFREPGIKHFNAMRDLARDMTHAIALTLSLPRDYFDKYFDDPIIIHRLNYYPPHVTDDRKQLSCGEHTDYGFFTLLQQIGGSGDLQVYVGNGKWVSAPAVPGMLNVNIGDLMDIWSNGMYKATLHRVVAQEAHERLAAALFMYPNYDAMVAPAPTLVSAEVPPKYAKMQAGVRTLAKYEATFPELGKTTGLNEGELFTHAD